MKEDSIKEATDNKTINGYDAKELIDLLKTDTERDDIWFYMALLLVTIAFSNNNKDDRPINIYINGEKSDE